MGCLEYEDNIIADVGDWPVWDIIEDDDDEDEYEPIPLGDMVPDDPDYVYRAKCIRLGGAIGVDAMKLYRSVAMSEVHIWDAIRAADSYRAKPKRE